MSNLCTIVLPHLGSAHDDRFQLLGNCQKTRLKVTRRAVLYAKEQGHIPLLNPH